MNQPLTVPVLPSAVPAPLSNSTRSATDSAAGRVTESGLRLDERYVLGDLLGRGAMAEVFRAHDTVLQRAVAIKLFRASTGIGDEQARGQAEIRLVASLNHPGLVTVFDAGVGDSRRSPVQPYLVMELVEGATLRQAIADASMAAAEVAGIGAELADALAYIHSRQIVHRDVKPANILLLRTDDGSPGPAKLTDFGIAQQLGGDRLTMHGATVGTANYLSPEQARGAELSGSSDVYSLGLVLLECLTGQLAYPGTGVEAALARLHRPPHIPASLGGAWVSLLSAMTAIAPEQRPTAAGAAEQLRALSGASTIPPYVPLLEHDTNRTVLLAAAEERPVRRRLPLLLLTGALLLCVGLIGAAVALRAPSSGVPHTGTGPVTAPTSRPAASSTASTPQVAGSTAAPSTKAGAPRATPAATSTKPSATRSSTTKAATTKAATSTTPKPAKGHPKKGGPGHGH